LVQFCEFDTSDGDWFIVTTPTDHPLTDPDTAFTNYNHGVNPFGYEFEHRDRALPRCERVYSPPPITVPPLRSAAEAAQFLDSLLEDTDG
jgi:hypothetical protein